MRDNNFTCFLIEGEQYTVVFDCKPTPQELNLVSEWLGEWTLYAVDATVVKATKVKSSHE